MKDWCLKVFFGACMVPSCVCRSVRCGGLHIRPRSAPSSDAPVRHPIHRYPPELFVLNEVAASLHSHTSIPNLPVLLSRLACFLGLYNRIVPHSPSQCRLRHRKRLRRLRKSPQEPTRRPRSTRGSPTQRELWVQVRAIFESAVTVSDNGQDVRVSLSSWSSTPLTPQPSDS